MSGTGRAILIFCGMTALALRAVPAPLDKAGYHVLPAPQQVTLRGEEFPVAAAWRIEREGVVENDAAMESLREGLSTRHAITINPAAAGIIRLSVRAGSVAIGETQDREKAALERQAYRLDLTAREIRITANAPEGLFYGVQTLVQLVLHRNGALWLPEGQIVDWPDLQLRQIFWDDAHSLETLEELQRAIRQAAFFKINGFVLKLDGHFQYASAPAAAEPQALSPQQYQELTDYALRYHVQLIPYIDAPGHMSFLLKHPEYARFRAFADCNYEMSVVDPAGEALLKGMCHDLIDANRGVSCFYLSTDEPYYVGMSPPEKARAQELGGRGKLLAEFVKRIADDLHDQGRTVVIWGEPPLKGDDAAGLPQHLVSGETGAGLDAALAARGIRQMIYTSTEGEEKLFPDYVLLPVNRRLHVKYEGKERVAAGIEQVAKDPARKQPNLMGMTVAGWADMGLHPETFWLGYATISAAGWNPAGTHPATSARDFYALFYGPSARSMDGVYTLMSTQAQAWADSWETVHSTHRKPIWGNSQGPFTPPRPASDQTLSLPPLSAGVDLARASDWRQQNARRLELAEAALRESDELLRLLERNAGRVEFNRYNLEVFTAIARLCRQNLEMLRDLARIEEALTSAKGAEPAAAVAAMDRALDLALEIRRSRNEVFQAAQATWYRSWLPRVAEGNGRRFVHELDDVKDHLPDRTIGMEYLIWRELLLPMDDWYTQLQGTRNTYAQAHGLANREGGLDWKSTK